MKATLDSVALSDYHDYRKLLFVICDGIVTGSGQALPTSEITVNLINEFSGLNPEPKQYIAIGKGSKQQNMAKVHAGMYTPTAGRSVPIIVVVKVGTEDEKSAKKPGNRGKRDSQMILINFLSKVLFDDAMTPLEHDLYRKITILAGVTPDLYELVMTVDADTKVKADAMRYLVQAMKNDSSIMGCCGETKVANTFDTWVSAIQVYEYYISHLLGKSFESLFGCVTCLPGCFSMYRIKAPLASGRWVPIITSPEIVDEYSENEVHTLHTKNLLLLGEDRFLTTLLLRVFPKRKTMYIPQSICETNVPDSFWVLLSQRRRWINSTIHNLFELVLVKELCGVFCFSMQFTIFMDLVGTFSSPAMMCFSVYLLITAIINPSPSLVSIVLMALMMFLPAVLIVIGDLRRIHYVFYMFLYLLSSWVFNLFDDFSWGETRRVAGGGGGGHDEGGVVKSNALEEGSGASLVPLKRYVDWELEIAGSGTKTAPMPSC
ncbi:glycosyltransferase family 2 protein [Gonapodya prolifera JEL478]|uniref:chitin synthase n=1 Tax=Gonapodya prolifera (strain JEL478) TaxID=1344416 RepID=A0A139A7I5_GONPJ|nr:glycosyltransferase family 2 protein [Gonapodya prolifera JEL478]|eukprot:KXS12649.1 glycosyltransferase family 2 protein [Gonapodya prolifera JEL478]